MAGVAVAVPEPVASSMTAEDCARGVRVVYQPDEQVHVPAWVTDLGSFRRWVHSDAVPEKLHAWFLKGEVWIDVSKEQIFTHLAVKNEFSYALTGLVLL